MEGVSSISSTVLRKQPEKENAAGDGIHNEKMRGIDDGIRPVCISISAQLSCSLLALVGVCVCVSSDCQVTAVEKRHVRESSVYDAMQKEAFYFVGHRICIRESTDSFGALVWPGVS